MGWRGRRRRDAHVGPLCPQLSEPANGLSQGGCCKGAGKLKQTLWLGGASTFRGYVPPFRTPASLIYALQKKQNVVVINVTIA